MVTVLVEAHITERVIANCDDKIFLTSWREQNAARSVLEALNVEKLWWYCCFGCCQPRCCSVSFLKL